MTVMGSGLRARRVLRHVLPAVLGLGAVLLSTAVATHRALGPLSPEELASVSCGRVAGAPVPLGC
jgi:hypothetical protein